MAKAGGTATSYTDRFLYPGTTYQYQISAEYYRVGTSGLTQATSITTLPGAPPSALTAAVSGPGTVTLSWQAAYEAAGYAVWRDGTPLTQSVTGTTYLDSKAPHGSHRYTVGSMFRVLTGHLVEGALTGLPSATVNVP